MVGPRDALRTSRIRLRDINWLGDGMMRRAVQSHPEVFVKVRSTRPPQPAWLREAADGGIDVELIASEDGVSPGQACAFYDRRRSSTRTGRWHYCQHCRGAGAKKSHREDLAPAH